MWFSILKKILLLSAVFGLGSCARALDIRVCLWEGTNPRPATLNEYTGKYRGSVYLRKNGARWIVINKLDLEEYLYGVVGKEMHKDWPLEALKAQAVCSRTLAVGKIVEAREKELPYDITAGVFHQVYGSCEDERVIGAVEETRDEVLSYGGTVPPVFFHSCCGGRTAEAGDVWPGKNPAGLTAVDDGFCRDTPYYAWTKTFNRTTLAGMLGTGSIRNIAVEEYDASGRARTVLITAGAGKLRISGQDLRMRINGQSGNVEFTGRQIIPGTMFSVACSGDRVVFTGRGYGHGVGMCQWGARRMAEQGSGYTQILAVFFPKMQVAKLQEE